MSLTNPTYTVNVFGGPSDKDRLLLEARDTLRQQDELLKQLQESSHLLGTIVEIDGKRVVVDAGGALTETAAPLKGSFDIGSTVLLLRETGAIVSVRAPLQTGNTATIASVFDNVAELQFSDTNRLAKLAPGLPLDLSAGDVVQVDDSRRVVLRLVRRGDKPIDSFEELDWNQIGGQEEAKEALRQAIEYPTIYPELYRSYGKAAAKGVLLYGPPGCGKTLLGRATATSIRRANNNRDGGFVYVKGAEFFSKFVGETEARVRMVFDSAKAYRQRHGHACVIFIDEAEALLGPRTARSIHGMSTTVVPTFLAEMDGLSSSGAFVILATNLANAIDEAILRDGRIDRRVEVARPNREHSSAILDIHLAKAKFASGLDAAAARETIIEQLFSVEDHAALRGGLSGAVLFGIVNRAVESALRRDVAAKAKMLSGVNVSDLLDAVSQSSAELVPTYSMGAN